MPIIMQIHHSILVSVFETLWANGHTALIRTSSRNGYADILEFKKYTEKANEIRGEK